VRLVERVAQAVERADELLLDRPLADEDAGRLLRIRDRAPAAQDLPELRAHEVPAGPLPVALHPPRVPVLQGRVVAEKSVLDHDLGHVDAEAGHAACEPEAQGLVEGRPHLVVPPVEVRLLRQELAQVELAARLVPRPRRTAEEREPVVRRPAVGPGLGPDVPVTPGRASAAPRLQEPGVSVARVVGHEVEEDPDPAIVRRDHERVEVGEGAEIRVHVAVV
jgi:hypothetical protein